MPTVSPLTHDQPPLAAAVHPDWVAPAQRRVFRYLRCLRCPTDTAEDLVQETMLAAVRAGGAGEPALAWLLTVARNLWFAHCRAQRRALPAEELQRLHDGAVRALGDDGGDGAVAALRECVATLPPRSQRALQLCYRDGLPRAEAAARLGLGDQGLKSLLARLREALEQCVRKRRNDDA